MKERRKIREVKRRGLKYTGVGGTPNIARKVVRNQGTESEWRGKEVNKRQDEVKPQWGYSVHSRRASTCTTRSVRSMCNVTSHKTRWRLGVTRGFEQHAGPAGNRDGTGIIGEAGIETSRAIDPPSITIPSTALR